MHNKPLMLVVLLMVICLIAAAIGFTVASPAKAAKPIQTVPPTTVSVSPTPVAKVSPTLTVTPTATVPPPKPTMPPAPTVYEYTIQPGDTFFGIAQRAGVNWQTLALVNKMDSPDQDLFAGHKLIVPNLTSVPVPTITNGKQIMVVIGQQKVYAFQDGILVHAPFLVSTGTVYHPTVLGNFQIAKKLPFDTMTDSKNTYYLPNVPWTMYFGNDVVSWHEAFSLHGTYWHHMFGQPMSHGCVNMVTLDAGWVYNWAPVGTQVTIIN